MTNQDTISLAGLNERISPQVWLKIIGIGESGLSGLSSEARSAICNAEYVFGGERHLSLVNHELRGKAHAWPVPFLKVIDELKQLRGHNVVVLTSGDPMHFGAGATLSRFFAKEEIVIFSYPSSFSLAAARLGWGVHQVDCLSVHGRSFDCVIRSFANLKKMFILAHDGGSACQIAALLCERGFGLSQIFILEHLEGQKETIHFFLAKDLKDKKFADLNIIAVNCMVDIGYTPLPAFSTLPDDAFVHDGQITKQDIRAITLANLAPGSHELLWDIGAGSGSISIEWLRLGYQCKAIAIEKKANRVENIRYNAKKMGVLSQLTLVQKDAIDALVDLEAPDAIFIGGGFTNEMIFEQSWYRLKHAGRMVVNAVTLESEALMVKLAHQYQAKLIKVETSCAQQLGKFYTWRPALPITMMILQK